MNHVRTVIMAGGMGKRLRPFTTVLPKPLLPVGDVPILDLVLRQLRHFGCNNITVTTGYLAELILTYLGDGSRYGIKLQFAREKKPLGTAGPLSLIPIEVGETFFVMNGDVLTNLNYLQMVKHHRRTGAVATVATYRRPVTVDKGVITADKSGRITGFIEKPTYYNSVAMGIYTLEPVVMKFIPPNTRVDMPEVIHKLLGAGLPVQSFLFDDYWLDIGQPGDYEKAVSDYENIKLSLLHKKRKKTNR